MGKLYEENWYQKWQKEAILGKFPKLYRYRNKVVPVQPNRMQPVPVQVRAVSVQPNRCNLYQYRSELYRYSSAQNVQNCVFLYN